MQKEEIANPGLCATGEHNRLASLKGSFLRSPYYTRHKAQV